MTPPSVMKSTGALSLPGVTPTTTNRDASRPEGARMSSAVRWAARKLDAFAAARTSGSRSPNWAVTVGAGFMSAPTNTTSALPLGADRDPNATLTVPLITNAYPLFGLRTSDQPTRRRWRWTPTYQGVCRARQQAAAIGR